MSWTEWAEHEAETIHAAGQWRSIRALDGRGPVFTLDGQPIVSFASNDYLGLSQHATTIAAAHEALDTYGTGAGSARLIVGARRLHNDLEDELAAWTGQQRAVLFPTGFAANLGLMSVFGGADVTIFSDELNHASVIDGCRLSRATVQIYAHQDLDQLKTLLAGTTRAIVVSDSVFSMDGDLADIDGLHRLTSAHGALLVLDEAHSVLGPHLPTDAPHVLRVGTLSKTLGSLGGFVTGPSALIDLLVNRARSFIFTTASTPADTAAALAALRVLRSPEGHRLVDRLRQAVDQIRPGHPSPIIPIVLGDEQRAIAAAEHLRTLGILVPAIRPPTVPPGTSRLRVTMSAVHTDDDIQRLATALDLLPASSA